MYEYIKGILTKITAKYIVVETAGIGYLLHVANPYAYSGKMNQEVASLPAPKWFGKTPTFFMVLQPKKRKSSF